MNASEAFLTVIGELWNEHTKHATDLQQFRMGLEMSNEFGSSSFRATAFWIDSDGVPHHAEGRLFRFSSIELGLTAANVFRDLAGIIRRDAK